MTLDTPPAPTLRGALAAHLAEIGTLTDPAWRSAVEVVPRHVFVPEFHRQQPSGEWETVTEATPDYLTDVYADMSLTTQLTDGRPTSSSSQPDLMLTMLEVLSVEDGMTVLEIATGSGYTGLTPGDDRRRPWLPPVFSGALMAPATLALCAGGRAPPSGAGPGQGPCCAGSR